MMDEIKNGVVVVEDDMGDGMLCVNHPYRNNPGGICAFCLQEKLGKLVSSSFPLPIRASSPSYRSETTAVVSSGDSGGGDGVVVVVGSTSSMSVVRPVSNDGHHEECYTMNKATTRMPFLLAKKKKIMVASSSDYHHHLHHHGRGGVGGGGNIALKRSKSASAPIRGRFLDGGEFSPRKKFSFWSFLYLSSKTHSSKKIDKVCASVATPSVTTTAARGGGGGASSSSSSSSGSIVQKPKPKEKSLVIIEDGDSLNNNEATPSAASSFERKVSRSRSVGCGSRSFSGDFFERISTGFGDCTLRRVESQREGKPKSNSVSASSSGSNVAASAMKERVRCGGIFGGFIITSSSSSSSSSSYWLSSSSADQDHHNVNGRSNKSWGWAFASPMRAFIKPSSGKKDATTTTTVIRESNNKNTTSTATPNLAAIPSLLTVRV